MPSDSILNAAIAIDGLYREKGIFLVLDWISQCLEHLQTQGPLNLHNIDETSQKVFDIFMECGNLSDCCDSSMIPTQEALDDMHGQPFNRSKPIVMQINEVFNAGAPYSTRKNPNSSRLLKLQMTDGYSNIIGIELEAIEGLNKLSTPGMKICIVGAIVYHGTLLLTNKHCKVLGGLVPEYSQYAKNDDNNDDTTNQKSTVSIPGPPAPISSISAIPTVECANRTLMDIESSKSKSVTLQVSVALPVENMNPSVVNDNDTSKNDYYDDDVNYMDEHSFYDKYIEEEMLLDMYDHTASAHVSTSKVFALDMKSEIAHDNQPHVISLYDNHSMNISAEKNADVTVSEVETNYDNRNVSNISTSTRIGDLNLLVINPTDKTLNRIDLSSENHHSPHLAPLSSIHADSIVDEHRLRIRSVVDMTNDDGEISISGIKSSSDALSNNNKICITNFNKLMSTNCSMSEGWIRGLAVGITIFSIIDDPMNSNLKCFQISLILDDGNQQIEVELCSTIASNFLYFDANQYNVKLENELSKLDAHKYDSQPERNRKKLLENDKKKIKKQFKHEQMLKFTHFHGVFLVQIVLSNQTEKKYSGRITRQLIDLDMDSVEVVV